MTALLLDRATIASLMTVGDYFAAVEGAFRAAAEGAFVAAVGADSPDKHEIAAALLAKSRVAVDSLEQCLGMGDLRHAVAAGAMRADDVAATLAELASGTHPGRGDERETWVFDSTGTAIQDVASALAVYRRAEAAGVGTRFAFG